jgi:hypothetical protein
MRLCTCLLAACTALSAADAAPAEGRSLMNLGGGRPTAPRFPLTDRTWPGQPGEAALCLWRDDKFAAYSVSIDDNCAGDVPWWLEQAQAHGVPLTWFVITSTIDDPKAYKPQSGTWDSWKAVVAQGHAVESHSVLHWHGFQDDGTPPADWQGYAWECTESKARIAAGTGRPARFYAYAGGKAAPKHNDPKTAIQHYLACRGGTGINQPNLIDYSMVMGMSSASWNDPKAPWCDPTRILDTDPKAKYFRGWACPFLHFVGKPEGKEAALKVLAFAKEHADELWVGLFGDVARYGQERDTATLAVAESTEARIAFDLADRMDDALYDLPLTVKVRLPAAWKDAAAAQDGKDVAVRTVEHEGARFALVAAVPDRGRCVLTPR